MSECNERGAISRCKEWGAMRSVYRGLRRSDVSGSRRRRGRRRGRRGDRRGGWKVGRWKGGMEVKLEGER